MTRTEFNDQWLRDFAPLTNEAMPSYDEYKISERMLEDYLDIFRGYNSREGENIMPYPHPFFDSNGKPLLEKKPCIRYILIGEARPPQNCPDLNDCGGDRANTYFYNIKHIGKIVTRNGREYRTPTPWLNAPRLNWGCPPFQPCPSNKVQTLLCLASNGVLLLDLFQYAIKYTSALRKALNDRGTTRQYWDDPLNPYNLQDRIRRISNLLCNDWDLTMVAPCKISEHIVNPDNGFPTLAIIPAGIHPLTFRMILPDNTRCISCNYGHQWKKIAVSQQAPTSRLIGISF